MKELSYREVQYAGMFREACCALILSKYAFNKKVFTVRDTMQVSSASYKTISAFDANTGRTLHLSESEYSAESMGVIRSVLGENKSSIHTYSMLPTHLFRGSMPLFKAARLKEIGTDYKLYDVTQAETGKYITKLVTYRPVTSKKVTCAAWDVTSINSDIFTRECVGYSLHNSSGNSYKDFNDVLTKCFKVYGVDETVAHLADLLSHLSYTTQHDLLIDLQGMLPNSGTGIIRTSGKE